MTIAPIGTSVPDLLTSISHFLWPAVAAVVLWKLMPVIREVLRTRSYKIDIGGLSLDVQAASDGLQKQIGDLQNQVAQLRGSAAAATQPEATAGRQAADRWHATLAPSEVSVLWVDDHPENNAYEIAALRNKGVPVTTATSTAEGLQKLHNGHFSIVISDMGRNEASTYRAEAGLELTKAIRQSNPDISLYVYTTQIQVERYEDDLRRAGITDITSSSVRLLTLLGVVGRSDD
jgi:CheY-like chemotaxis protein